MSKKHAKNNHHIESSTGFEEITNVKSKGDGEEVSLYKSSCLSFTKSKGSQDEMDSTKPLKRKMSNWTKLKNRLVLYIK
jgi:hypothetical protein